VARLTFDGFPRTGNSWLSQCLVQAFPADEVAWGAHRAATLRYENNVIATLRAPQPAVASYMLFFGHGEPDALLDWYCRFTTAIITYRERVFVAPFAVLTEQPQDTMRRYADRFGLGEPVPFTFEQVAKSLRVTHAGNLPRPVTRERSEAEDAVAASPELPRALGIYEQALSSI
jgi:hypothetical protein